MPPKFTLPTQEQKNTEKSPKKSAAPVKQSAPSRRANTSAASRHEDDAPPRRTPRRASEQGIGAPALTASSLPPRKSHAAAGKTKKAEGKQSAPKGLATVSAQPQTAPSAATGRRLPQYALDVPGGSLEKAAETRSASTNGKTKRKKHRKGASASEGAANITPAVLQTPREGDRPAREKSKKAPFGGRKSGERNGKPAPSNGVNRNGNGAEAEPLTDFIGVFEKHAEDTDGTLRPLNKKLSGLLFLCPAPHPYGLTHGAVVRCKVRGRSKGQYTPMPVADVVEIVAPQLEGMESAIAIEAHKIPSIFPVDALKEAETLSAFKSGKDLQGREDLRQIPIVTIDGKDARDFDDAVWAEAWQVPAAKQKGYGEDDGFHIIVAIADVAHYIREGSPLDAEAFERGNSVYFPDKVVPMLPERLSNDLCSLRPNEDRPVLAVHLYVDARGNLVDHRFARAVIHSHARLTYEQVQEALDGNPDKLAESVLKTTLTPLYKAYKTMLKARDKRGALDLDVPEKVIYFGETSGIEAEQVFTVHRRARLDSHRLIEEMMIMANVAAASALQSKGAPCLYRIHPAPGEVKMQNLKMALKALGVDFSLGGDVTPKHLQRLIEKIREREAADSMLEIVLRSQEQARYEPQNIGHFGLALGQYAHFTSPIRRYADLVVHRSLIRTLKLAGEGALTHVPNLTAVGEHLGDTERRAQKAEWDVRDRMTVRFYKKSIGEEFDALVTTVTNFGVFISIESGVAEGLIPMRLLDGDRYDYNAKTGVLNGRFTRRIIKLGMALRVRLEEADMVSGRLAFAEVRPSEGGNGSGRQHGRRRR